MNMLRKSCFFYQIRLNIQLIIVLCVCLNCFHKQMMHLVLKLEKEFDFDENVNMLMDMLRQLCFVIKFV